MTVQSRLLSILLSYLLLLPMLTGCGNGSEADPPDPLQSETQEEAFTGAETQLPTPDYSSMKLRARTSIPNTQLGLRVSSFTSSDPYVADFEAFKNDLRVYIYNAGVTEVTVTDAFGHTASFVLHVTEEYRFALEIQKCSESFLEVSAFGAKADDRTDDSAAFQAMIDAAKPGDTVYAYAGNYYVSFICMREGVTLRLATTMTDARAGYTKEIQRAVKAGKIAVLRGIRIMNNGQGEHGSEGSSNFKIIGGMLDMDGTTRGAIIFGCADNVFLENIIFKDIKNNHAIQFTGCTNSKILNCMFAGYVMGDYFTREIVQIEPSTPGATGAATNPPLRFYEGEYHLPQNILISDCYFGKSDTAGAPLMAIGHHSHVGKPNVTGLRIVNNVFDDCIYAAIRYNNIEDVVIDGNTFIATEEWNNNTKFSEATTPAFIILYHNTGRKRYTSVTDGSTITEAEACEQSGIHNLQITNNTFDVGKGSDKRVLYYTGLTTYKKGAYYSADPIRRQEHYNSTPVEYTGYVVRSNYGSDWLFCGNHIRIHGQPTYNDHFLYVKAVFDFKMKNNWIETADGVCFSDADGKVQGILLESIYEEEESTLYLIEAKASDCKIMIRYDGRLYHTVSTTADLTLRIVFEAGGRAKLSTDAEGNLYVDINNVGLDKLCVRDENFRLLAEKVSLSKSTTFYIGYAK